jgi:hypothetical protein
MAIIDFQKEAKQPGYRFDEMAEKDLFKEILKLVIDDSIWQHNGKYWTYARARRIVKAD